IIVILGIAVVRFARYKEVPIPAAYFALLVPSVALTVLGLKGDELREQISFNMSGPLSLAVCAAFFFTIHLTRRDMKWVLTCLVAPAVSIATISTVTLQKAQQYATDEFGNAGNRVASGGFGPNQVSAALGLGILAVFLILILGTGNVIATGAFGLISLFLIR